MNLNELHNNILEDLPPDQSREMRHEMQELIESSGWKKLAQYLEIHYKSLLIEIAGNPISSLDDALPQEHKKGQAAALLTLLGLPENLIQYCENNLQLVEQAESYEEELDDGWQTELE